MEPVFSFKATLEQYQGAKTCWHFLTVPKDLTAQIKAFAMPTKGFRSVPVKLKIGDTQWKTSLFPMKEGTYFLPVKKAVRDKESLELGKSVECSISLQI